jgi:selenocysteine lyase/cysteine desulfurase
MYAPFGTGALVGHSDTFMQGPPEHQGGGTVDIVTPTDVSWAELPDREEAGSPNVIGAVAMAAAAEAMMEGGMEAIARHETVLTDYALSRLQAISGLTLYGARAPVEPDDRVGVIAFNLESVPHALVAAILGYEGGIGVRNGCFCAQSYVAHLLGLPAERARRPAANLAAERADRPGMVRLSLGVYNTRADVDALATMLERIVLGDYRGVYSRVSGSSDYSPAGYRDAIKQYLSTRDTFLRHHPR